eukprot:GFYU01005345.1.p1 GENE.GFYU01005345.1~~GFYU01005345.1.p1  ORF type:complete len:124 (+),score=34.87 GFYU01005345.1:29-400(+)
MLRPKVLPQILEQAKGGGVVSVLLLKKDGSLVATGGEPLSDKLISAIVGSTWVSFEEHSADGGCIGSPLQSMMVDCENGHLLVTRVADSLLCAYGSTDVEFGLLKAKIDAIAAHIAGPLEQVM